MALIVPDDWDETTYKTLTITIPASAQWQGVIRGALLTLTDTWRWDDQTGTGTPDAATETAWQIYESIVIS